MWFTVFFPSAFILMLDDPEQTEHHIDSLLAAVFCLCCLSMESLHSWYVYVFKNPKKVKLEPLLYLLGFFCPKTIRNSENHNSQSSQTQQMGRKSCLLSRQKWSDGGTITTNTNNLAENFWTVSLFSWILYVQMNVFVSLCMKLVTQLIWTTRWAFVFYVWVVCSIGSAKRCAFTSPSQVV